MPPPPPQRRHFPQISDLSRKATNFDVSILPGVLFLGKISWTGIGKVNRTLKLQMWVGSGESLDPFGMKKLQLFRYNQEVLALP